MDICITPGLLRGEIRAVPSKSYAHRLLICAAFAAGQTRLEISRINEDIEATVECLNALGARICRHNWGYEVTPFSAAPEKALLPVRQSGSTLRFLLPVVGALGVEATFIMEGRLSQRPISPLWEEMERLGCKLQQNGNILTVSGKLHPGIFHIPGNISSQFLSGVLFAAAIRPEIGLEITGSLESKPYVDMTRAAIALFGTPLTAPGRLWVEGDWSNAAFFLTANALGNSITVSGLKEDSLQGDRAVTSLLSRLKAHCSIDASHIPDLIPALSVAAACNEGAVFTNIRRLRLKESDRVASIAEMIEALGGRTDITETTLTIHGTGLKGGTVNSHKDHRIAMAAAIAATICENPVTICNAEAVNKSYPDFWEDYRSLGGNYEQYIR